MRKLILKIATIAITATLLLPTSYVSATDNARSLIKNTNVTTTKTTKYYVTADMAPVRSGPTKHSPKIAEISKGMVVKAKHILNFRGMKKANRWAEFKFNGYTAYVSLKHLSKKPPIS